MSQALINKMRAARERKLTIGEHTFTLLRPAESDLISIDEKQAENPLYLVHNFVVGWDLKETDLYAGGEPVVAEFSRALWIAYIDDHGALWADLSDAIRGLVTEHQQKKTDAKKK